MLGALVTLWGFGSLGPNLTPGTEPLAAGQMVERGAYAWVRHPIYVGLSLFLAGWSGWTGNPATLVLTAVLSFGYFDRKAAAEERWMTTRFPGYAAYQHRVGKLWPRLRARAG
ncbi:MAG: isoprenylcysteine carboxylmethyltransferase family protein [Gemmatimonadetes bacterium]|nr:isoprenylcysteine carboxylmethyltransferase family protein [Gemmatimonadota bacterium]